MHDHLITHTHTYQINTLREYFNSKLGQEVGKENEEHKWSKEEPSSSLWTLLDREHYHVDPLILLEPYVTKTPPQVVRWEEEKPYFFYFYLLVRLFCYFYLQ